MSELNPYAKFLDGRPLDVILSATSHEIANKLQMIGPDKIQRATRARQVVAGRNRLPPRRLRNRLRLPPAPDSCRRTPRSAALRSGQSGPLPTKEFPPRTRSQPLRLCAIGTSSSLRKPCPSRLPSPSRIPERGAMTFQTIVETMAGHDLNHLAQLRHIATK